MSTVDDPDRREEDPARRESEPSHRGPYGDTSIAQILVALLVVAFLIWIAPDVIASSQRVYCKVDNADRANNGQPARPCP